MIKPTPGRAGERRAHVRYCHTLRASGRLLGKEARAWAARVEDLSRGGVKLLMECEVRPGAVLVLALAGLGGRFARPVLVRVMNAARAPGGHWQVGCAFVKPLPDDDVQALLLAPAPATL
jgi:hypothetical protein